jgi:hypothetical protein
MDEWGMQQTKGMALALVSASPIHDKSRHFLHHIAGIAC